MEKEYFTKEFTLGSLAIGKLTGKAFSNGSERFYEGISIERNGTNVILQRTKDEDFIEEEDKDRLILRTKGDLEKARKVYDEALAKVKSLTVVDNEDLLCSDNYSMLECAGEIRRIILDAYNTIERIATK